MTHTAKCAVCGSWWLLFGESLRHFFFWLWPSPWFHSFLPSLHLYSSLPSDANVCAAKMKAAVTRLLRVFSPLLRVKKKNESSAVVDATNLNFLWIIAKEEQRQKMEQPKSDEKSSNVTQWKIVRFRRRVATWVCHLGHFPTWRHRYSPCSRLELTIESTLMQQLETDSTALSGCHFEKDARRATATRHYDRRVV